MEGKICGTDETQTKARCKWRQSVFSSGTETKQIGLLRCDCSRGTHNRKGQEHENDGAVDHLVNSASL